MSPFKSSRRDLAAVAIKHVGYPLWALKNGSARLKYLAQLEKSQHLSREVHTANQWAAFQRMFVHAVDTCPYYREKYRSAGIKVEDVRSPNDIRMVPPISKQEIQEHLPGMMSTKHDQEVLIRDMTGGSTGSPMTFYYNKDGLDRRVAATIRHNRWAGWDIGDRAAILWGAPQDTKGSGRLKDRLRSWIQDRHLIMDASRLNEAEMARFARELLAYRPTVLQAYSNTLGLFARYVKEEGIHGIRPRAIVCSAEVLTDENRILIEETFQCQVYNRYGCREFAVIASECDRHEGLHINAENLLVEVASDGGARTEDGEILITDLRNFVMPMIRYRIRDVGRISDASCSCSRGLPLMEVSGGRVTDFLTAANGTKVSGIVVATYVVTNIPGIRQIQFVQHERGTVTVNLVKGPAWSARTMTELTARVHRYLGDDMQLRMEFCEEISLEKSGKYRFSISTLA